MAEPAFRSHAVVRPLSRAATRRCARPGCPSPAQTTLTFAYDLREARLESLTPDPGPQVYDLCTDHADRTRPPNGWMLVDDRPEDVAAPSGTQSPRDLGSEHTVAVLAAALRAAPRPATDDLQVDLLAEDSGDDADPGTVPVVPADEPVGFDALEELTALATDDAPPTPAPGRAVPAARRDRD
jgi:hypothetical protein